MKTFISLTITFCLWLNLNAQCNDPDNYEYLTSSIENTHRINFIHQVGAVQSQQTFDNYYFDECGEPQFSNGYNRAFWIGGYDEGNSKLKIAAKRYEALIDYIPGPINEGNEPDGIPLCESYNRVWKITSVQIHKLRELFTTGQLTVPDIPIDILEWPAINNPHLNENAPKEQLAHFVDTNNDNQYDPLDGDYPIPLSELPNFIPYMYDFTVYNDQTIHYESNSAEPVDIEIRQSNYVLNCEFDIPSNHTVFTRAEFVYKGVNALNNARISLWEDVFIGCSRNNYIGCDTLNNVKYVYKKNGEEAAVCWPESLPFQSNASAIRSTIFLNENLQSLHYYKTPTQALDTFPFVDNDWSTYPFNAEDHYFAMNAQWLDGSSLTIGSDGQNPNGQTTKFAFPDLPIFDEGWSMETAEIDPNFSYSSICTFFEGTINPGQILTFDFADYVYYDKEAIGYESFQKWPEKITELKAHFDNFQNVDEYNCFRYTDDCQENCVWPGDTNTDQTVTGLDYILSGAFIGKQYTGTKRSISSDLWHPFAAIEWNNQLATINSKHGDATGDGKINERDLDIVVHNFGYTTPESTFETELPIENGKLLIHARFPDDQTDIDYTINNNILDRTFKCTFSIEFNSPDEVTPYHGVTFDLKLDRKIDGTFNTLSQLSKFNHTYNTLQQGGDNGKKILNEDNTISLSWTNTDGLNFDTENNLTNSIFFTLADSLFTSNQDSIESIVFEIFNAKAINADGEMIDLGFRQDSLQVYNLPWDGIIPMDDFSFNLYPNPTDQFINLALKQEHTGFVEVFSRDGRKVETWSFESTDNAIFDMSNLPAGLYCLRVNILGGIAKTEKIIKVH